MGKKLYEQTEQGIRFTSRRKGQVRIPNYIYDLWLPLLGAKALGIYAVYCRLEREQTVKGMNQKTLARACRISPNTLQTINKQLEECGFIEVHVPQGLERVKHWTTEIAILDPPREISKSLIRKYEISENGYIPLTTWLVTSPAVQYSTAMAVPKDTAVVVSSSLHPSEDNTSLRDVPAGPGGFAPENDDDKNDNDWDDGKEKNDNENDNDNNDTNDCSRNNDKEKNEEIPVSLPGWKQYLRESKNPVATLMKMLETLYPNNPMPSYGRLGAAWKRRGTGLVDVFWGNCQYYPSGNPVDYAEGSLKEDNEDDDDYYSQW